MTLSMQDETVEARHVAYLFSADAENIRRDVAPQRRCDKN
jgi:hypothetical protein